MKKSFTKKERLKTNLFLGGLIIVACILMSISFFQDQIWKGVLPLILAAIILFFSVIDIIRISKYKD